MQNYLLTDFIKTYPSLSTDLCSDLIDLYERSTGLHENVITENDRPRFTQMNFTGNLEHLSRSANYLHEQVVSILKSHIQEYASDIGANLSSDYDMFPFRDGFALEQFRIKKYECNQRDCFREHVDVRSHATAKRFLAFLWYLNDDFMEGETEFTRLGRIIQPNAGTVLIFPPLWLFPHSGNMPESNPKYIMSTYLHYL